MEYVSSKQFFSNTAPLSQFSGVDWTAMILRLYSLICALSAPPFYCQVNDLTCCNP